VGDFAAAIEFTKHRDLDWSPEHPPLSRLIAGLPFRFVHVSLTEHDAATSTLDPIARGVDILYHAGNNGQHLIEYSRYSMVALTLVFMIVVYAFGRVLWGPVGGLLAAAVASLDPTLLPRF